MDSSSSVAAAERDFNALGGFFHIIINDLRGGANNWDDLLVKANKFHMQLKATINASTAFLDAFQKIADLATTTRSGTKEIGSALTRLCLRHRSVEAKMKSFTNSMLDSFILPLQDRVEEWKRIIAQLDKDHSKELKRLKQLKKKTSDARSMSGFTNTTFRIKRNPRSKLKSDFSRIGSMYDINRLIESMEHKEKYFMLEEVERNYVRRALIEERSHYCLFFNFFRPVVEEEIAMLQEVTHLEEVLGTLIELTSDPYQLPPASESLLTKLHFSESSSFDLTYGEPESPSSTLYRSRKSSISSINSINSLSTDSISLQNCKSLSQPNITPEFRPKSIASQDSGFISHDYNVPNIGRMTISSKSKSILENPSSLKSVVCPSSNGIVSNKGNNRTSIASFKNCLDGEYASAEQIYSSSIRNNADLMTRSMYALGKQPIYANVGDNCNSLVPSQILNRNYSSDGSITPTNQGNSSEDGNENEQTFRANKAPAVTEVAIKTRPKWGGKTNPPKPPIRHSSTLSTGNNKPPKSLPNSSANKSTRIYVVQDTNNLLDFPPPPPEAYVNYATPSCTNQTNSAQMSSNSHEQTNMSCCDYSLPNSHLVLCNDINCLKGMQSYGGDQNYENRNSQAFSEPHYESYCTSRTPSSLASNARKSYAFESTNSDEANHCEPVLTPIYSDCSGIIPFVSSLSHSHSATDRARSVPNRRFHSTINLSQK